VGLVAEVVRHLPGGRGTRRELEPDLVPFGEKGLVDVLLRDQDQLLLARIGGLVNARPHALQGGLPGPARRLAQKEPGVFFPR
jgi:hypothetical protein